MNRKIVCLAVLVAAFCAQLCAFQKIYPTRIDYSKGLSKMPTAVPLWQHDIGWGNFDERTQALDILVVDVQPGIPGRLLLYSGEGDGTYSASHTPHDLPWNASKLACADFNQDGHLDAATSQFNITFPYVGKVAICYNDGWGGFTQDYIDVPLYPCDVVAANFDNDPQGRVDLAVACGDAGKVTFLFNEGQRVYTRVDVTLGGVVSCITAADLVVDPEGRIDVAIGDYDAAGGVTVLRSDGNRTFTVLPESPAVPYPADICAGFLDGDAYVDLAVVNPDAVPTPLDLAALFGDGTGGFERSTYSLGDGGHWGVSIADIDGSLGNDIVSTEFVVYPIGFTGQVDILRNTGNRTFQIDSTWCVSTWPIAVALPDLNSDGAPDLVTEGDVTMSVSLSTGQGTFEQGRAYTGGHDLCDVVSADFNGDGVLDVAAAEQAGIRVFINEGTGTLGTPAVYPCEPGDWMCVADFDNDDDLDIFAASSGCAYRFLVNQGDGTFLPGIGGETDGQFTGCCAVDLDNDQLPDVAVADQSGSGEGRLRVFWNRGGWTFQWRGPYTTGRQFLPGHLAAANMNNAGPADVCMAGEDATVTLFLDWSPQNGFTDIVTNSSGVPAHGIAVGCLDQDNLPDVVVADARDINHLPDHAGKAATLKNLGGGLLGPPHLYGIERGPCHCQVADVDGAAGDDVVTAGLFDGSGTILLNTGSEELLQPHFRYGFAPRASGLALADLDDDGDQDAIFTSALDNPDGMLVVNFNSLNNVPQSSNPKMTYPNQTRHIGRAPNHVDLDWVYQSNHSVFWRWRDATGHVGPVTRLATGKYPAITEDVLGGQWVAYADGALLKASIRRSDGSWREQVVQIGFPGCTAGAPSLVISKVDVTTCPDIGYVVYVVADPTQQPPKTFLYLSAFDSLGVYYQEILDHGDISGPGAVSTPSIAVTPGDYLTVAWCKDGEVLSTTTQSIVHPAMVRQNQFPLWWPLRRVSQGGLITAEPGSNCFVEAQGEQLFVVWRAPYSTSQPAGEVYRRTAVLLPAAPPQWNLDGPRNRSNTPTQESDYPVMSTADALVWAERMPTGDQEIVGQLLGQPGFVDLSNTPATNSDYPNTEMIPQPPNGPDPSELFSLWTEEIAPESRYEVRYSDHDIAEPDGGGYQPCLTVTAGESLPSPYCLGRDGSDRTSKVHYDYSDSSLTYRLPYLHPLKYYYVEAVVYQNRSHQTKQRVRLPNGKEWNLTLRKSVPETLRFVIPRELYDSTELVVHIDRLSGSVAALASVKLYEFETIEKGDDGSQSAGPAGLPTKPSLAAVYPNPFRTNLAVRYQLPCASRVSLKVYDMTGRLVKTLANGTETPGTHIAFFRGLDDKGRSLPAGVYLVRFTAGNVVDARRVVLTR